MSPIIPVLTILPQVPEPQEICKLQTVRKYIVILMSGICSGFPCTTTIQYSQHTLLSTWHLSISFLHPLSQPLIPPGHSGTRCMQVCLKRMTVTMRNGSHDNVCWPVAFRTNLKTPPSLSGEIHPNSPRKSSPDLRPSLPPQKNTNNSPICALKAATTMAHLGFAIALLKVVVHYSP